MDTVPTVHEPIHYPEPDGKPTAETDVHILERLRAELARRRGGT